MRAGALQGLVNGTEQVVYDYEVTGSAVSSIPTGNILNGDEDGWYTIIFSQVDAAGAGDSAYTYMRPNGDSGANYGHRDIYGANTTVGNDATVYPGVVMTYTNPTATRGFAVHKMYAKSGAVRLVNGTYTYAGGTTVYFTSTQGAVWNNTADNITSMTFASYDANGMGVGTRIIILKSNNFTNGTPTGSITTPYIKGTWFNYPIQVLGSATNTVTFSGLDGDRDVLYSLSAQYLNPSAGSNLDPGIVINSDSGSNYGHQYVFATNTAITANRLVTTYGWVPGAVAGGTYHGKFEALMFAKQGFVRPMIVCGNQSISGTLVSALNILGEVYQVTNTNITSLAVTASQNFGVGSQFRLSALRPNG